jgi:hypothetical protein
LDGND